MTYRDALSFLKGGKEGTFSPDRMERLMHSLGNPQKNLSFVHVAGTNGKGSFCAMLSNVLKKSGLRVGLYTSPHLIDFRERMQVDGTFVSEEAVCRYAETVKKASDGIPSSFASFDFITAVAFLYFHEQNTDCVVLEVGLGGRLDATNVIDAPLLSVIMQIGLDHTALLGNTIEAIAREKAGIIKPGCPVLYGGRGETAQKIISDIAKERNSPFYTCDFSRLSVQKTTLSGILFQYREKQYTLSLVGTYQPYNATAVLEAVDVLRKKYRFDISDEAVAQGLSTVCWQARFEMLHKHPCLIADGGHNPNGVTALKESIEAHFPCQKVNLCMTVMKDKDYTEMVRILSPVARHVFALPMDYSRALPPSLLAEEFEKNDVPVTAFSSFEEGMREAIAQSENIPLIFGGSLYLYEKVSSYLRENGFPKAPEKR